MKHVSLYGGSASSAVSNFARIRLTLLAVALASATLSPLTAYAAIGELIFEPHKLPTTNTAAESELVLPSVLSSTLSMHNSLVPTKAAPTPLFQRDAGKTADAYVDAIKQMEVDVGPYAVGMAEPLLALGRLYH